ncbi:MAG: peptidase, partial [Paucibacter sp.]|nr:peptidase [Roseateles sp.]
AGRLLMFAPNPYQGGSSVSHFDTSATRNLLMEPAISADLTQSPLVPQDLTFKLLQDIGW